MRDRLEELPRIRCNNRYHSPKTPRSRFAIFASGFLCPQRAVSTDEHGVEVPAPNPCCTPSECASFTVSTDISARTTAGTKDSHSRAGTNFYTAPSSNSNSEGTTWWALQPQATDSRRSASPPPHQRRRQQRQRQQQHLISDSHRHLTMIATRTVYLPYTICDIPTNPITKKPRNQETKNKPTNNNQETTKPRN